MKMAQLDTLAERAEAENDRELQRWVESERNNTMIEMENIRAGAEPDYNTGLKSEDERMGAVDKSIEEWQKSSGGQMSPQEEQLMKAEGHNPNDLSPMYMDEAQAYLDSNTTGTVVPGTQEIVAKLLSQGITPEFGPGPMGSYQNMVTNADAYQDPDPWTT